MDAGFITGGALSSVTESSVSQNGALFPEVLLSLNAEPIAPAKESRENLAMPPYRCSGVSGFFAEIWAISPVEPLFLFGKFVSRGSILPPPLNAAKGAEAHAIAVATLLPKNIRREIAMFTFSLANVSELLTGLTWEPGNCETGSWDTGKKGRGN